MQVLHFIFRHTPLQGWAVKKPGRLAGAGIALLSILSMTPMLQAQPEAANPGNWPMFNRDLASTRHSPLTQINRDNVTRLQQAWSYRLQPEGVRFATAGGTSELTPLVIDGTMYISAMGHIAALNPATGEELWRYEDIPAGETEIKASPRGVAYWPGDGNNPARVIFTTGHSMVGLNAGTGRLDPGFGREGVVDLVVPYNGVPTIYGNLLFVGASTGEAEDGPPGDSRTYDARTGEKLWEFRSIPEPGQVGHDSWIDEGWRNRSGVNTWGWFMAVDEELDLVYIPFGGPAANYFGGDRPGANLFGNSLVAIDTNTGEYRWHFQLVHHDLWDYDLPPGPTLVDIEVDGVQIPALAEIGKNGWMYILNRETGEPVFGVEERAVPAGNVPGEWYSPTQPFPVKPAALERVSLTREDIVTAEDTTPEHAAACLALWEEDKFYNAGPYTPWLFHPYGSKERVTIAFPGATGGASWGGVASDPATGYVFVATKDQPLTGWIEDKQDGIRYENASLPYDRVNGSVGAFSAPMPTGEGRSVNLPCYRPPWSRLTAVDANTGEFAWQVTLGTNTALPEGKQNVGGSGSAGPMVTAGGLVFVGAALDGKFRAFDSRTGDELWSAQMVRPGNSVPMTYTDSAGKQYVAITASDTLMVYTLP